MLACCALLVLAAAQTEPGERASVAPAKSSGATGMLRASAGVEYDTNARRQFVGSNLDLGDLDEGGSLLRVIGEGSGHWKPSRSWLLGGSLILGAKRFNDNALSTEDLLTYNMGLSARHMRDRWSFGATFLNRLSRVRSGLRDYGLSSGTLSADWRLTPQTLLTASASGTRYVFEARPSLTRIIGDFEVSPNLSFWGPRGDLSLRQALTRSVSVEGGGAYVVRVYDASRLTPTDTTLSTLTEARTDSEWQARAAIRYEGPLIAQLRYLGRFQDTTLTRSGSLEDVAPEAETSIQRHRLDLLVTVGLPWELFLSANGQLLLNVGNPGAAFSDNPANFDENQNALQVELRRNITSSVSIETRYAFYGSQLTAGEEDDVSQERFSRHTVFLGISGFIEGTTRD